MKDGASTDEGINMDAADAAVIMQEAGDRARDRIRPSYRGTFTAYGVLFFIGYGLTWLAVRDQRPFHGPAPAAFAAISLIGLMSALLTVEGSRNETGVRGQSVVRRRILLLSALSGYAAMFALEGALARAGAGRAVIGVFEAAGPLLVTGMIYLARSAVLCDWSGAGLGFWLIVVAAAAGYIGPWSIWAVAALAVGPAFLLTAAIQPRLSRS
jgi:hypothetical protein